MLDATTDQGKHAAERLRDEQIIWLTTVTPSGQPQSSPVWFIWDGRTILLFSKPDSGKIRNLAANPAVALHLADDGDGGDIVSIEGRAELLPERLTATELQPYLEKYAEGITDIGLTPESMASTYSQAIRVTPSRIRIW